MICDDAVIRGGEPVAVKSVLTVNTLGKDESRLSFIRELAGGLVTAAGVARVGVINGELAQHNDQMGHMEKFLYDWSGDVTWFAHTSRLISGENVTTGDYIVGLREEGIRSNGISLLRRALNLRKGDSWEHALLNGQSLGDMALIPSRIYTPAIVDMTGGWNLSRTPKAAIHAAAHITGGGLPEKLGRALGPSGLGAVIDDPFFPSELLLYCQEAGINDHEAYKTWNMGQGMALVTSEPDTVLTVAREHAIEAKVIGHVTSQRGIVIKSKGLDGGILKYT
jgi:phosphoribosylformylglycinamidine cyclo-ligase